MTRKIKLSHTEVEVRLFLEVLAVYGVLALALVGIYYLGPAITGFVTVTKEFNYSDDVNLEFSESAEYVWNLANPGNLKSIKISGSKSKQGDAKVYIEDNGIRYLIFDSSRLVENPSGMFGITGFAAAEDKGNKSQGKEPNHPPVWNYSADSFIVNRSLTLNLDEYFNDKDNDVLTYTASELKTNDLEILLENEMLTVNNKNNIEANRTLEITASDNETSKKKNIVLILIRGIINETIIINDTPIINESIEINETIINETTEKIINVNLEYSNNEFYDANNDGVESLDGIIDFSVKDSDFNWEVNKDKLCTRYEVYSADNEESTFACFGNDDCCNFVGLQSSRELWDENLFLSYGGYGSTANNIVFAQVLYVDYDLDSDAPYSDIAYSSWGNLTAKFLADIIEFEGICIDTCLFDGNASSYKLIVEASNTTLRIGQIMYVIEERSLNNDPLLIKQIGNISILENKNYTLELNEYFYDEDSDELIYSYDEIDNITIRFEDNLAYIIPENGFIGERFTFITASDSYGQIASNVFKVEVKEEKLSIEILSSAIKEKNWTIEFSTAGTGNLTISAGGTYAEMYDDNASTINDLDILELKCGEFEIFNKKGLIETEALWFVLMNGSKVKLINLISESMPIKSMYIKDYNCDNDISQYTAKVLTEGEKTQEFNFSNEIRIIGFEYVEKGLTETFEIRGNDDNKLAVFDSLGNLEIKGNLTQNVEAEADGDDFIIEDMDDSLNLVVTNPEGNLQIKGSLNENQSMLLPTPNSFIIQNRNEEVVAYVNGSGSLFLKGALTENVLFE